MAHRSTHGPAAGPGETEERQQSLWLLAVSPTIWAAHFMACYLTAAIWCAKYGRDASLAPVRIAVAVYTVAALLGIGTTAWRGYRKHAYADAEPPHDADTRADRHRFLGFATLLLSGVSAVAVVYAAMAAVFAETCR